MIRRVLLLSDASAVHTRRWEKGYRMLGWKVYTVSFEYPAFEYENFERIETKFYGKFKYLSGYFPLNKLIDKIKPDLILPHFIPNYGLLSFFEKFFKKIPYVITIWGSDLLITPFKNRFNRFFTWMILRNSSGIVVDAKFMKEILMDDFGIEEKKILVIPFGIEKEWREKGKSKRFVNGKVGIITYRKMEPLYNQKVIVKALKKFSDEERKNFYVDWIGTGSLSSKFREMIYNEGLFDIVRFNGYVSEENLQELLFKDQIYLSSSLSDGTSVSLIEAMSFGLFPIVSDIKGNREWVVDGVNGFLFNPKDSTELYLKIKKGLKDKSLRENAFYINRKIVEEKANWEENILKFKKFVMDNI